jgi:hypothetical protein
MWELWRDKWGVGGLDLDLSRNDESTATQAVRYAIRYCQHQSGVVAPWVLEMKRLPRAFELYGELREAVRRDDNGNASAPPTTPTDGPDDTDGSESATDAETPQKKARTKSERTVGERMLDCGIGASVLLRRSYPDGSTYHKFLGPLPLTPGRLAIASKFGELPSLSIKRTIRTLSNGEQRVDVSLPVLDGDYKATFDHLDRAARGLVMADLHERQTDADAMACGEDIPF